MRGGRVCDPGPETSPRASLHGLITGGANGAAPPTPSLPAEPSRHATSRPLSVQVQNLRKTYDVPRHQTSGFDQRLRHPVETMRQDSLTVLDGVSFKVERGELFGILGRNGSGKSTLLRILAGIYAYDSGSVRVAPRVAPVIELGVGFQPEFAALRNVIMNLEMLGRPRERGAGPLRPDHRVRRASRSSPT